MNNKHLSGASRQKRCPSCEHHPILADGRCLDCGYLQMAAAPPALAALQPTAEMAGSEIVTAARLPQNSGFRLQEVVTPTFPPAATGSSDAQMATVPPAAGLEEPFPKKRRLAPEICGFAEPKPKPRKGRKKLGETDSERMVHHLSERVNEENLAKLASRQIAATWKPAGSGPTLRRIVSDFLTQVRDGELTTVWWEEDRMTRLGYKGRRYSGYRSAPGAEIVRFEGLLGVKDSVLL